MIPLHALPVLVLLTLLAGPPFGEARADPLLRTLQALAQPLRGAEDLGPLVKAAGGADIVLLGEASHGTHEFHVWRDRLSRRLIVEHGFDFIAIEADWTSLLPLDRYVRHRPDAPGSAREALEQIGRWPRWVWANSELEALGVQIAFTR